MRVVRGATRRAVLAAVVASATAPALGQAHPLAGTDWRLAELRSGGDVVTPHDPSRYELGFGQDGSVTMRLDCNRARADVRLGMATTEGGTLAFGPVAMTRALCPDGSLDTRIALQLENVTGWRFQDGRLVLVLADGATQTWMRHTP